MQKSLPLVKATIKELVESGSDVPKWILTSFNDPSATVVTETHISADLITAAELLSFGGGGDTKEQALKGKYNIILVKLLIISNILGEFQIIPWRLAHTCLWWIATTFPSGSTSFTRCQNLTTQLKYCFNISIFFFSRNRHHA